MSILLDTNAFLWFITDNSLLSESNGNYIENFSNTIYLSIASIWEIAIKFSIGKLESTLSSFEIVFDEIEKNGIELLAISNDHLRLVSSLPFHHRDPFDRLIIAQSLTND